MKNFLFLLTISALAGFGVAWGINYTSYDRFEGALGPMKLDRVVNAKNVIQELEKTYESSEGFPKAEMVGESRHDFGAMSPGDNGEHVFVINNTGDQPLTLELGATTCKCTLGELSQGSLKPGEQTDIKLSWTVKTTEDFFEQNAEIRTNDPAAPALRLVVAGKVVKDIAMEPTDWSFGAAVSGEEFVTEGKIYSFMDSSIEPLEDALSFANKRLSELTTFEFEELDPAKEFGGIKDSSKAFKDATQVFKVTATTKPGMRQGAVSTQLYFRFKILGADGKVFEDAEGGNEFLTQVDVSGRVMGSLSLMPSQRVTNVSGSYLYNFGAIKKGDSLKATTLMAHHGSQFKNSNLSVVDITPKEGLKVSIREKLTRKRSKVYELEIEIVPQDEPMSYLGQNGEDFGRFWIESDNPKVARMQVGIKFAVDAKKKSD